MKPMRCRTLAAVFALAALALPSVLAEDPVVTVPQADPGGPSASAQALAEDAADLAAGAAAIAAGLPGVVLVRCPAPTPPDPPQCDAFAVPADEAAQLEALLGQQGAALVADAAALAEVPVQAFGIVAAKGNEGAAVTEALLQHVAPAGTEAALLVTDAVQAYVCPVAGLAPPEPACGPDSVLTAYREGVDAVYASGRGLVVKVDAGPTCLGTRAIVASLSPEAANALDCGSLPSGGALVALLP